MGQNDPFRLLVWEKYFDLLKVKPNGMYKYSKSPKGVVIAVKAMESSSIVIWW